MQKLAKLLSEIRSCRLCQEHLEHGVRPVLRASSRARLLIAGQAPGRRVHESGVPFDDPSGVRLREWMGIDFETFYDESKVAIVPMGFCYPGTGKSGDLAPRAECAPAWRDGLLAMLKDVELTLVIGRYAMEWHLGLSKETLTTTVQNWEAYAPSHIPLPHPSPRNNIWLKKNSWFEAELLPELKRRVSQALR